MPQDSDCQGNPRSRAQDEKWDFLSSEILRNLLPPGSAWVGASVGKAGGEWKLILLEDLANPPRASE